MALISTYWGLVRPLRHHFRTGSQAATASKEHLRNRSTIPPNEEDAARRSIAVPAMERFEGKGSGEGGPVRWKPLAAMPAFDHPPLGNAATPATHVGNPRDASSNHARIPREQFF